MPLPFFLLSYYNYMYKFNGDIFMEDRLRQIIEDTKGITEEEVADFLEGFEFLLDSFYKVHKEELDKKDIVINNLLQRMSNKELELLDKDAIMEIFKCESDKALKILKLMYANHFGCKIGKMYYITRNEFIKFMESYKGQDLKI